MASDKLKRFRTHVVKELYETERNYTSALEFTVTSILEKAREKFEYDNSFTEENIQTLFCNIEDILKFHQRLMGDLSASIGSKGPSHDSLIAQCYLRHRVSFDLYRIYGENNEHAQKLLYELEEDQGMKAFFIACMLLGGKGDNDISSFLFKPIQRVCKYPLLFRELLKYTPTSHPDYEATKDTLDMMRDVCSVINEARRRMEKLEAIADWQATVDGWEGSNVTDTCNELVKEGLLVKISAGNTQERMFFLFDNLFVYCKKSIQLSGKTRLLFRGRIAVENMNIEDIEDGSSDYHTNHITVTNSWKVHNISKNKWFVLIAKTNDQKQEWMEAMRRVKEQRKREQAGRASNTRNVILHKGEKLYHQFTDDHVPKDHKLKLKTYPKSFTGKEFIKWLLLRREVEKDEEGVILGQALLENGVIHHVNDRHQFKNNEYLYRFRYDDNSFRGKLETSDVSARSIRIYCRLHALFDPLVKEHRVGVRNIPCVVMSQKLIDWWLLEKDISRRIDGVALGEDFFATGVLRHITDEQNFKDGQVLYRFTADDGHEVQTAKERRLTYVASTPIRSEFSTKSVLTCKTVMFPFHVESKSYGVELVNSYPVTIKSLTSKAQTFGVSVGDTILAINGHYITPTNITELFRELVPQTDGVLYLIVQKTKSQSCTLVPSKNGLGFHIRGGAPVIISDLDIGSAASDAGLAIGSCIVKVGEKEVAAKKHDEVVAEVKKSLEETAGREGERNVRLKLSLPFVEQLSHYQYESVENVTMKVYERNVESPYVFVVPAKLLKLYSEEILTMVQVVTNAGVLNEKVIKYLEDIKAIAALYIKTNNILSLPRWPSYKLHGTQQSIFLKACPTNLHTSIMGVVKMMDFTPPSPTRTRGSISDRSMSSESEDDILLPNASHTSYCISTLQIPTVEECTLQNEDMRRLEEVQKRRKMLMNVVERVREMIADYESIKKITPELKFSPICTISNGNPSLGISLDSQDDLTPLSSPTLSPVFPHRPRFPSVSNPEPVLKLVAEGLIRKGESLEEMLEDELLISMLCDTKGILDTSFEDVLVRFKDRLNVLAKELRVCTKRPGESLSKAAKIYVDTVKNHMEELSLHLWISLILCDKTHLLESLDKLFSQSLTTIITAFSQQLSLALRGQLNTGVEYGDSNSNCSKRWLQMVMKKGVLVYFEGTMLLKEKSELTAMKNFCYVLAKMECVTFILQPVTENSPPPFRDSELPPVTLDGGHDMLRVTFHIPPSLYYQLPHDMTSGNGIKIHTVLFNKGLVELEEEHLAYLEEKTINTAGLRSLEAYYKHIRAFRLDKSNLPSDSDEKTLAINKISIPLNAMDFLMRQIRTLIQEPTRSGAGLLTLAAELTTRMGALRVNFCNSGVYRSGLTTSVEHAMVLGRCHGLPFKIFRSTLNIMRRKGRLSDIIDKNQADFKECIPKQPLKLYQLPSESEASPATDTKF